MDGLELCRRIRTDDGGDEPFILIVTAHDDPARLKERRLRQAAALRAAKSDLSRARWLAGIGETALAMEREISGPLHAMLERASRLLEDVRFDDDQRDHLRIISEQGARLAGVVGRAVNLQSPQSVEYLGGARMIDLSGAHHAPASALGRETPEAVHDGERANGERVAALVATRHRRGGS